MVKTEESRQLNPNGNGLGLHICRRIAECMGGSVHLESEQGQGTMAILEINTKKVKWMDLSGDSFCMEPKATKKNSMNNGFVPKKSRPDSKSESKISKTGVLDISGKIIIAEDQRINLETLKMNFEDIGLTDSCMFAIHGQ